MFARYLTCAGLALAPTLVISAASAQEAPVAPPIPQATAKSYNMYVRGAGGYAAETDFSYDVGPAVETTANAGYAVQGAIGLHFAGGFRAEIEGEWVDRSEATSNFGSGAGVEFWSAAINGFWDFGRYQAVNFYIGGGAGGGSAWIADGATTGWHDGWLYQGMIGFEVRTTESTRLYFEAKAQQFMTTATDSLLNSSNFDITNLSAKGGLKVMF
jgi:opacity protein-like surface antigen